MLKKCFILLVILALATGVSGTALAADPESNLLNDTEQFTHPELGEQINVEYINGMPVIHIYGKKWYEVVDTSKELYRGMRANYLQVISGDTLTADESMDKFLTSIKGEGSEPAPVKYSYCGEGADYSEALDALPREQWIEAIKILNGLEGIEGFEKLKQIPGFENVDIDKLTSNYKEYTILIDGVEYKYRVIMFRVEDADGTCYYERYNYVYVTDAEGENGEWKLARITKEYVESYDERVIDIYGMEGSDLASIFDADGAAMRGVSWNASLDDVAASEPTGVAFSRTVRVDDVKLYELNTTLTYVFDEESGDMLYREYALDGRVAYYSAFTSLYIRYADPVEVIDYTTTWILDDVTIVLTYDEKAPMIRFYPRVSDTAAQPAA